MVLKKAGSDPIKDVTGASSFKSTAPRLDRGEMQARIARKAFLADFQRAGYPILADLEEYLPNGYRLRVIAAAGLFLEKNRAAIVGYLKSAIRACRLMKTSSNHAEMIAVISNSDLKCEEDMTKARGKRNSR